MNKEKIGWIGLGKMGIPMSRSLIKAGYNVTVYNRTAAKKPLALQTALTPADLIQKTDIVFVMVSDDQAIREIFNGVGGLLNPKVSGKIIVNMSTVSPALSREMAGILETQGNYYLDAPVSGSVKQADEATLVIMVGGPVEAYEKARPILEKIGHLTMRVGDSGAGNTAKLIINTLLGIYSQGLAEAYKLASECGIKGDDLSILLNNSALSSPLMKIKGDQILGGNFSPMFALKHLAKDLRLAKDIGLATPLGLATYQTFQDAEPAFAEEDIIAIVKQLGKYYPDHEH